MPATEDKRDVEAKIVSEEARSAHHHLLSAMPGLGLTPSQNSGHVLAVRLHDVENRYAFSWIPAKGHLLFYIRKPALAAASRLRQTITSTGLHAAENPAGEITVRIERDADARILIDWLQAHLPL